MLSFSTIHQRRIAFWGFVLNALWEFVQCPLFYDMSDMSFWAGSLLMWGAIIGDVVIVLAIVRLSAFVSEDLFQDDRSIWMFLIFFSLVAAVLLEWAAMVLDLWQYKEGMPTLYLLGQTVGLVPVLQISILPALSLYLASQHCP